MSSQTSENIVQQLQNPVTREKGYRQLVHDYKEKLYWLIRRIVLSHDDTDDILQNVFIKVWQNLDKFRGDSDLYTWVYRIAVNESLAFINRQKKHPDASKVDGELYTRHLEADKFFDGSDLQARFQKALLLLPEQQRIVFNLRYFDEMKYQDMAKVLNRTEGALKANYHHAVKKIEEYFSED